MGNEVVTQAERNITDGVLSRVNSLARDGGLILPPKYSAANALKSAWLILQETKDKNQNLALTVCSRESIANSLLDMVIQGLNPAKRQCYFVVYGKQLQLMRSYMGTVTVTKRLKGIRNVYANCIYADDEFDYEINLETGTKRITVHKQKFQNIDIEKIVGAYAVVVRDNDENFVEVMNIAQIRKAWGQGATKGTSGAHTNFTDEMAKKVVINRACKLFANTGDDSDLLVESFNRTSDGEFEAVAGHRINDHSEVLADDDTAALEAAKNLFSDSPQAPPEREPENGETDAKLETPPEVLDATHSEEKPEKDIQAKKSSSKATGGTEKPEGKIKDGVPDFVKQAESEDAADGTDGEQQQIRAH